MKKYSVTIPIAGAAYVTVEVPDDATSDQILAAACEAYDPELHYLEWEFHEKIAEGNVLYASPSEWSFEEKS